jgi:cell division protein ZipA
MRGVLGLMSALRWTLLILGVLFIAVLAWWERRRPRQASGALERAGGREPSADTLPRTRREPALTLPEMHAREPLVPRALPVVELPEEPPPVPVLEPAAAGAARADAALAREAAEADTDADADADADAGAATPPTLAAAPAPMGVVPPLPRESLPELPPAPPPLVEWPPDRERRVLALRLVAPLPERFAGRSLRQALAAEGFVLGQFAIFHKPDEERRAVLSAASLTRPGTFDRDTMDSQHYGGLSLFAVLPGPKSPPQAFDELVFTARNLNERLHGVLQDEQGTPLTPARIALLREQLRAGAAS